MAIVKMKKLTLAAPINQRDEILDAIQSYGLIHMIDLTENLPEYEEVQYFSEGKAVTQTEIDYNYVKFAYEFLKQYNNKKESLLSKRDIISKEEFDALESEINWQNIYRQCRDIDERINSIKGEKSKIASNEEQYIQWSGLDINEEILKSFKKTVYFIGTMNSKYVENFYKEINDELGNVYIEKISEKQQDVNLFILCYHSDESAVSEVMKKYGFSRATIDLSITPKQQVKELESRSESLDIELEELKQKAEKLTEKLNDIKKMYDYISVKLDKERTVSKLLKTSKTFILQGWITVDKLEDFKDGITSRFNDVFLEFEDPKEDEIPPVALKNNAFAEPFEAITSLYSLPLPTEIDPTPVLAPFFMFFFGMMMADIGYGLLLAAGAIFMLVKMELNDETKKLVKIMLYCSIPTIVFGVLYGSFFGGIIKMKPLWIDPVSKPMDVLIASIAFGMIHLFTGLGVKGYQLIKSGQILDAIYDVLFWYGLIIGLIWLLLGGQMPAKIISIVSAVGLVATQGRQNETIIGKFFGGLYGLYGITGYLGDALSYSRLLALGLATGLIGWSFNLLIGLIKGPAVYVAGPVIFIAGHTFNFLIGLLGTFVHTCRLQYLEFFGKFYEGGGKAYAPLKINTKFINVKTQK